MKHSPITDPVLDLTPALAERLTAYREHRGFAPHAYVRDKARALARYAEVHGLKSLVVGVSGGVDSALVAMIAARAAADADLPGMYRDTEAAADRMSRTLGVTRETIWV